MNDNSIQADSFVVKSRNLRIYRIRHSSGATILWLMRDDALRYLKNIQGERLQAEQGR